MSVKRRYWVLLCAAILLLGWYVLTQHRFSDPMNREVTVTVYEDGEATGESIIRIDGERVYTLLSEYRTEALNYYGVFAVEAAPATCQNNTEAHVYGWPDEMVHTAVYYQYGDFLTPDWTLLMDRDMTEIAIGLEDGKILATSAEMYRLCLEEQVP